MIDHVDKSVYRRRPRIVRTLCYVAAQAVFNAAYRAYIKLENSKRLILVRIWLHEWEAANCERSIEVRRAELIAYTKEIDEMVAKEFAARSGHNDRIAQLRERLK